MKVVIENVRTFSGRHEIPIRPLTILTGENSSGKSTFLAVLSAIADSTRFPVDPPFNLPPYNLGGYDTIASQFGSCESFALGWSAEDSKADPQSELARYRSLKGGFFLSDYELIAEDSKLTVGDNGRNRRTARVSSSANAFEDIEVKLSSSSKLGYPYRFRQFLYFDLMEKLRDEERYPILDNLLVRMIKDSISVAPIRTKPERTYDRTLEASAPDGSHIPFTIARVLSERSSSDRIRLIDLLTKFGVESGLFKEIEVRSLGRRPSDPFQLQANVSGGMANLTDVGYGVSQSLPVVTESVLAPRLKRLLIQQPEVHLHPKAQAALGSFFVNMVVHEEKEFVIETHSDYIVDRIRQEVAQKRISNESVLILYFSRRGPSTKVHAIYLDDNGNIVDAPPQYRSFFLREELNLLKRTLK